MFVTGKYVGDFFPHKSTTNYSYVAALHCLGCFWPPTKCCYSDKSIQASTPIVILSIIIPIIKFRILNNHYSYMSLFGRITPTSLK